MIINRIFDKYNGKYIELGENNEICGNIVVDVSKSRIKIVKDDKRFTTISTIILTIHQFHSLIDSNGRAMGYSGIKIMDSKPVSNITIKTIKPINNIKFPNEYNHNSTMGYGKYRNRKLSKIPKEYLINVWDIRCGCKDESLITYIENNFNEINGRGMLDIISNSSPNDFKIRLSGKQEQLACPITNKYIYITEREAKDEIKRIAQSYGSKKKPHRCYECEHCNGWHLTSKLSNVELKFSENN